MAVKKYNPRRERIVGLPAIDNNKTLCCPNIECFISGSQLEECERILYANYKYAVLLRCTECEAVYFGGYFSDTSEVEEYRKQEEARQEAQKERAMADAEEAYEANMKESEEEERAIMAEVEEHEAQENGDIILPNLITV